MHVTALLRGINSPLLKHTRNTAHSEREPRPSHNDFEYNYTMEDQLYPEQIYGQLYAYSRLSDAGQNCMKSDINHIC